MTIKLEDNEEELLMEGDILHCSSSKISPALPETRYECKLITDIPTKGRSLWANWEDIASVIWNPPISNGVRLSQFGYARIKADKPTFCHVELNDEWHRERLLICNLAPKPPPTIIK